MVAMVDVAFPYGATVLDGTLHLPAGDGPHPAVMMLQGSGDSDRDSFGFFPPIRDRFLDAGIAVLSWDKQGVGASTGDWRRQTIADRAAEARVAFAWLRGRDEVDPARIGVWGHSQGGWIGPIVAAHEPDLACLVIHSGTGVSVNEQDHFGMEHTIRRNGASEEDVALGHVFMHRLHVAAGLGIPYEQMRKDIIEPGLGTPWLDYFGELDPESWQFFVRNARDPIDPLWALRRVTCPTLAIFGEEDVLVPVERSIEILEEVVRPANPDLTIRVFPGASHRLQVGDPPQPAPGYLDAMTTWVWGRLENAR